jgi:hypothetical protein
MHQRHISQHMREQKRYSARLELKYVNAEGVFAGYASIFDVVDSQRDAVMPGAFRDTLARRETPVKLLWQHRLEEPIGVITQIFEDARGLYIEGRLLLEVAQAREAYALLKAGAVSGLSIGYSPRQARRDPDTGVRRLFAVDLVEVSLVTLPANHAAQVTVVKGEVHPAQALALSEALEFAIGALRI